MEIGDVLRWFQETEDIPQRVLEHVRLSFSPVIAAALVAFPIGLYIGHRRRFELLAVTIANVGRAIPSFAVLALAFPISLRFGLGLGFWPTFVALFALSLPPILTNTYVGVKEVDRVTVDAARGMGLSELQIARSVEIPLALPLIVAGVRTAAVQSVATASLAALVAGGGAGTYIFFGLRASRPDYTLGGALVIAALAILTELVFALGLRVMGRSSFSPIAGEGRFRHLSQAPRAGGT